ncbi:MAG TPA: molybdopterin-synthase adenylyltransferase MoeB [Gemmatimonadaceae bacterium]
MHRIGLNPDELTRYARQIRLPNVGLSGQERLKRASVLIVGAGGLGSPAAIYLAAAGVGRIGIADGDRVDASNLHRQPLYDTRDVGMRKVESARAALLEINPFVAIDAIDARITSANALDVISQYDLVIDGTDNFPTRYLLNDACVLTGRALVYGSVDRFEGQASVFATSSGPCYRCLYPEPPARGAVQSCAEAGVLGVLPGLVGTIQATEALKLILELGDTLEGRLLLIDALSMRFRAIAVDRDPTCPACGTRELTALIDYETFCNGEPQHMTDDVATIDVRTLHELLNGENSITLIDVREPQEWNIGRIPGARLVPLGTIQSAVASNAIDREADIVLYCHHGTRSEMATRFLNHVGFRRVRNLVGGIDRWSIEVDPSVPRY